MSIKLALALACFAGLIGIGFGYFLRWIVALGKKGSMELQIKQMMLDAREEAKKITKDAEEKAEIITSQTEVAVKEKEDRITKAEERIIKKEEFLDKRQVDIDTEVEHIKQKAAEIKEIREKADVVLEKRSKELEKIAGLSHDEAKKLLLEIVEKHAEEDLIVRTRKLEMHANDRLDRLAKDTLATIIQRLASSVSAEVMTTTVPIPSEEMKGKIIGKEGRNIKAFERTTGVELIVDDTPDAITISSFDPVRRQVARVALEHLIQDGRIQPAKIEEAVEKAKTEIDKTIKEKGEQAAYECGVFNLDPRIISILGRLHFRTSYGQNVLQHSIEVTHIAGMLAQELGANVATAKAGALLHDIGKAVDHEVAGSHVEIGRRILQKFNAPEEVIKAMQAHHGEYPYETIESVVVQVADAITDGRRNFWWTPWCTPRHCRKLSQALG